MGKTGAGKSSLGNTLLGTDKFKVERSHGAITFRCQWEEAERFGTVLQLTDTPGVADFDREERDVLKEVGKSIAVACPGPHVVLFVLRSDIRFTKEEYDVFETLKKLFGPEICKHMIIVYTHVRGNTPADCKKDVDDVVKTATPKLCQIMTETGDRYFGVNNDTSRENRDKQAEDLLDEMKKLVSKNGDQFLNSELFQDINARVEEIVREREEKERKTHEAAVRDTKKAIVEEKEKPGFFQDLIDRVKRAFLRGAEDGTYEGTRRWFSRCSVM